MNNSPIVHQISECYIKPNLNLQHSNHQFFYLTHWDLICLSVHYNQKGLLFRKPNAPDFSMDLFLDKLKHSLELTLVHFYPLTVGEKRLAETGIPNKETDPPNRGCTQEGQPDTKKQNMEKNQQWT